MNNDFLCWLVDKREINIESYSQEEIIDFVNRHKLYSRFIDKIERTGIVEYFEMKPIQKIYEEQKKIVATNKQYMNTIKEIQDSFPNTEKPIFIKGPSSIILNNTPQYNRYSGDIDLFFKNVKLLGERLIELGFTEVDMSKAPHEDSFFERGDVEIEVHKYYPILGEPPYSSGHKGHNRQLQIRDVEIEKLEYSELYRNSVMSSNQVADNILVVNICMAIFVLSLHIYKDLQWEPYRSPLVKINELFEIYDLLNNKGFNPSELVNLSEKLNGKYCVEFVLSLVGKIFDIDIPAGFSYVKLPLIKLMNDSFSPYLLAKSNTYYKSLPYQTFTDTIKNIGYRTCEYNTEYYTKEIAETYYASTNDKTHDFSFVVENKVDSVEFVFRINDVIHNYDNFFVTLDDYKAIHLWLDDYPDNIRLYGERECIVNMSSTSYEVKMEFKVDKDVVLYAVIAMGKENDAQKQVTLLHVKRHNS